MQDPTFGYKEPAYEEVSDQPDGTTTPFTLRTDDALGDYTNIRMKESILRPGESVPAPPHRILAAERLDSGRLIHVLWWEPIGMPDDEYTGAETFWNGPRKPEERRHPNS